MENPDCYGHAAEEPPSEAELLRMLTELGVQRAEDERHGGAIWAEFSDWCWAMDTRRTPEMVALFAADREAPLSDRQLEHLTTLACQEASP